MKKVSAPNCLKQNYDLFILFLYAEPDPDRAKSCGSVRIRIRNPACETEKDFYALGKTFAFVL